MIKNICLAQANFMTVKSYIEKVKDEVYKCVHCGFCLTACPTYLVSGQELESPRGRISLMKATLESQIEPDEKTFQHWDRCIQCRACEPACPSGVNYGMLIESTKAGMKEVKSKSFSYRFIFNLIINLSISKWFINLNSTIFRIYNNLKISSILHMLKTSRILPSKLYQLATMIPKVYGSPLKSGQFLINNSKFKIALFRGCIMPGIHGDNMRNTVKLLNYLGFDVEVVDSEVCCGSISSHNGDLENTIKLAKHNIDLFLNDEFKYLLISSAGCGTRIKEYYHLFDENSEYWLKSKSLKDKTLDIYEFLYQNIDQKPNRVINKTVSYQPACHLLNTQKVIDAPIELIKMIPGIKFIELPSSNICCGAGGAYSITQPIWSKKVLDKKMNEFNSIKIDVMTVSNPGCFIQLQGGLKMLELHTEIMYVTDLLYYSYIEGEN
jgi:glycolate oxidase iron-sulfur subunit